MNIKTKKAIEAHIERIVEKNPEDFSFENQRKFNPDACPCYTAKPCHEMSPDELNCFLCYCPEYDTSTAEGGCKLPEKGKGKWFHHPAHPTGRIWDCSDCNYPNREETVRKYIKERPSREYLKALFGLQERRLQKNLGSF